MKEGRYIFTSDVHLGAESGGGSEEDFIGFLNVDCRSACVFDGKVIKHQLNL